MIWGQTVLMTYACVLDSKVNWQGVYHPADTCSEIQYPAVQLFKTDDVCSFFQSYRMIPNHICHEMCPLLYVFYSPNPFWAVFYHAISAVKCMYASIEGQENMSPFFREFSVFSLNHPEIKWFLSVLWTLLKRGNSIYQGNGQCDFFFILLSMRVILFL